MGLTTADYISLGTSALSTGSGIIGGILANRANARENQKNREWNEKMWHMTNEYNLPSNVVARYQSAGLNPALALQDGTNSLASYAGNLGTQKAYENPLSNVDLGFNDIRRLENETKVADSQVKLNEAEAYRQTAEGNNIAMQNDVLPERLKHEISILGYEDKIKNIEAFVKDNTYNNEIKLIYENAEKAMLDKEIAYEQKKVIIQELANLAEEYENLKKQGKVLEAEELLNKAKVKTEETQQTKNIADAYYTKVLASKVPSEIQLNRANARKVIADAIKSSSDTKVNDAQIFKIANDVEEQLYNGNTKRALDMLQPFGSSVIGSLERNIMLPVSKRVKAIKSTQRKNVVNYKSFRRK